VLSQVLRDTGMLERHAGLSSSGADRGGNLYGCRCCARCQRFMLNLPEKAYPLIGALIGYHIRR
jgi:hypothetical protein